MKSGKFSEVACILIYLYSIMLYFNRVIEILLEQSGTVVDLKNRDQCTALHLSLSNGHLDVLKVF
jgi:hypothetical protein